MATSSVAKRCQSTVDKGTKRGVPSGKIAAVVLFVCALGLVWEFRRPWFQGNLGVVDPGKVIRTAQPTAQLPRWVREFGLKSILNLRGGSSADWWYAAEARTADENGLAYYVLPLSATRRPTRSQLLALIDVLEGCPYPLLIHCKSGADRTGLASALYLMLGRGETPERAKGAFSLEFGHVPLGGTEHLHEPLREYAAWLKANRLPHTAERFRSWVETVYQSADSPSDPPPLKVGPDTRPSRATPAEIQ